MAWQSKGVVTFPAVGTDFPNNLVVLSGISGSAANKIYTFQPGNSARFVYTVGTFSGGAATATRDTTGTWRGTRNYSGTVDGTSAYLFRANPTAYDFRVFNRDTGAHVFGGAVATLNPVPSSWGCYLGNNKAYILDSETVPRKLLAYTTSTVSPYLTADTANDITLASGGGTTAMTNPSVFTDGTFIWVAGIHASNARRVQGFAYRLSDRARVSARDFDYTDTADVGRVVMTVGGEVYAFRRGASATRLTNTARVLEFIVTPPAWATIPAQVLMLGMTLSFDVAPYLTGSPTPAVAVTSGTTLPSWLSLSGTTVSGTPPTAPASQQVRLSATNAGGTVAVSFTILVSPLPRWQSKGVVTLTGEHNTYALPMNVISTAESNQIYLMPGNLVENTVYRYVVGDFRNGHATAALQSIQLDISVPNLVGFTSFIGSATVGTSNYYFSGYILTPLFVAFNRGSRRRRLGGRAHIPLPSVSTTRGTYVGNNRMYYLDSETAPRKLLAHTIMIFSPFLTADTANDITLASGAGTVAMTNPSVFTDGTYIWIAGINASNARRVQGWCYQLSDGARVSARDFDYTDTADLARVMMMGGDIYAFRRYTIAERITNTVRMLVFGVMPTWLSTGLRHAVQVGTALSWDVVGLFTGSATVSLAFSAGYTAPSWLTLSGTTLSGTPPAATYTSDTSISIQLTATDTGGTASQTLTLQITQSAPSAPAWVGTATSAVQVETALRWDVLPLLRGTPTPTLAFTSGYTQPSWLTLSGSTLSGTPPAATYATDTSISIQLTATNSAGTATQVLTLWITQTAPAAPSGVIPNQVATVGTAFSLNLLTLLTGVPALTFSDTGNTLGPTGLMLSGADISGTPQLANAGAHDVTIRATNALGFIERTFRVTVRTSVPLVPGWQSRGVVTFPVVESGELSDSDFRADFQFLTGITGSEPNKVYAFRDAHEHRWVYAVSVLNGVAVREAGSQWDVLFTGKTGTVDESFIYLFKRHNALLSFYVHQKTTGASVHTFSSTTLSPNPSDVGVYVDDDTVYLLDSETVPTKLLAYTVTSALNLTADTSKDIALALGSGTTPLKNPVLFTDLTHIWLAGVIETTTMPVHSREFRAWCYRLSDKARVPARDVAYTDTADLARALMTSGEDVYLFRAQVDIDDNPVVSALTNTARVLTFGGEPPTPEPTWAGDFVVAVQVGIALDWDVVDLVSGIPTPTVAFSAGYTSPAWLSLSGTTLAGTPPAAMYTSDTSLAIQLTATNSVGTASQELTLWITQTAPAAPSGTVANKTGVVGVETSIALSLEITGVPAPTFSDPAGSLEPTGLTLSGTQLRGEPNNNTHVGTHDIALVAINAEGIHGFEFNYVVSRSLPMVTIPSQTATVGIVFTLNLAPFFAGTPTPTFDVGTSLADTGLTLTGTVISGTPASGNVRADAYPISVTATNASGAVTTEFNLMISA